LKTEKHTRKELIDKQLKQAFWDVEDRMQVIEEYDIKIGLPDGVSEPLTPYQGHLFCDYVLLGKDGKILAVVEVKKTSVDAAIGREQAKQYCYHIKEKHNQQLPFCYYTNGYDIYFWDLENYPPKKVYGFPTIDDLERLQYFRKTRKPLAGELINTKIAGRDYQLRAIRSVMEKIEQRKRKFLLVNDVIEIKRVDVMKFERLGNIVHIKKGKKPDIIDVPDKGSVRVLQIDDLRNDKNLKYTNDKSGVFVNKDDILIAWDGANAGTIGYGKTGYIGSTIALLRKIEPTKYFTSFIGKFLQSRFETLRSNATGATIPHIDRKTLDNLKIPIISYFNQLHITNILNLVENLIVQRKESICLLDNYLKNTFLEMFGDPVRNEKGFGIRNLSEFYINSKDGTKCGPFGSALKKDEYTEIGIPVWTMYNILKDGQFVIEGCLWISEKKHEELKNYNTKNGDIIISRAGTVGKMCIIKTNYTSSIISSNLIRLRLGNRLLPIYFLSLMKYFQSKVIKLKQGNEDAYSHMSTGILDKINFPYPPLELQTQFAQIVDKTEVLKAQYQISLQELENLYGSLSQRAFKGELNAKDEEMLMAAEPKVDYITT